MGKGLFCQAVCKFLLGLSAVGLLLFLPAGRWDYWQAWLLMGILFIPMPVAGMLMMWKNPELLRKRLNVKEQQAEQSLVIKLSGLMFLVGFTAAGFSFRFGWLLLPDWVSWLGTAIFLAAYLLYGKVLRENTYLSRTVEVQKGQRVVDTGLYGLVRHPMYSATVALFLSMPLVLGSAMALAVFLAYPFIIAKRIQNEEAVLEKDLDGYPAYKKKVIYRLIPFIW